MYPLEWFQKLTQGRSRTAPGPGRFAVSPVVLSLGLTSLLTDVSSEMVNSLLPAYLVLHLHLSPLQYGLVDGLYNGFAIALLSLAAGYLADRASAHKWVALTGYGLSGVCKLLLLAVGTTYAWILLVVGMDRLGKGIRAAPRDALISLNSDPAAFANAFSVHRAMDACGSLLGPIVAFVLLAALPGAFDAVWVTSFVFAMLGVAALWLFVPAAAPLPPATATQAPRVSWSAWRSRRFMVIAGCGALLALTTISDGFVYLMLQEKSALAASYFPLFYVSTAAAYMLFAIPAGRLADRTGRAAVFVGGYVVLVIMYATLCSAEHAGMAMLIGCLAALGLYYAATEGILMALASAAIPAERRTSGIAIVATGVGLGKLLSSVAFGALWQSIGMRNAVIVFAAGMGIALIVSLLFLRATDHET
jgi:MFS family permease